MKTLANIKTENYVYNHIVYDNSTDKHFAKHSHSLYEIIYVIDGQVEYTIEDRKFTVGKNQLVFIKPFTYHYFCIKSTSDYQKIGILFNPIELGIDQSVLDSVCELIDCKNNFIIDSAFKRLTYYYKTFPNERFIELFLMITKELAYNLALVRQPLSTEQYQAPILSPILKYINENLFSINTLDQISTALNMSTSYLKAIFKRELKIQPKKYINEKRLLVAKQKIWLGEKPTVVSAQCGFENYSTFYRAYSAYFGFPPSYKKP
jgi:AraC-like DNA-binding protein